LRFSTLAKEFRFGRNFAAGRHGEQGNTRWMRDFALIDGTGVGGGTERIRGPGGGGSRGFTLRKVGVGSHNGRWKGIWGAVLGLVEGRIVAHLTAHLAAHLTAHLTIQIATQMAVQIAPATVRE
jgi:hypothetical protein